MKVLMMLGKALAASFWLVFAAALLQWLDSPFEQVIYLLAGCLLVLHGLQLWLLASAPVTRGSLLYNGIQIMLFGSFHLYPLHRALVPEAKVTASAEVAHA